MLLPVLAASVDAVSVVPAVWTTAPLTSPPTPICTVPAAAVMLPSVTAAPSRIVTAAAPLLVVVRFELLSWIAAPPPSRVIVPAPALTPARPSDRPGRRAAPPVRLIAPPPDERLSPIVRPVAPTRVIAPPLLVRLPPVESVPPRACRLIGPPVVMIAPPPPGRVRVVPAIAVMPLPVERIQEQGVDVADGGAAGGGQVDVAGEIVAWPTAGRSHPNRPSMVAVPPAVIVLARSGVTPTPVRSTLPPAPVAVMLLPPRASAAAGGGDR